MPFFYSAIAFFYQFNRRLCNCMSIANSIKTHYNAIQSIYCLGHSKCDTFDVGTHFESPKRASHFSNLDIVVQTNTYR